MPNQDFTRIVLSTRPEGTGDGFANALHAHGIDVLHIPMIKIVPPLDWAPLDEAVGALEVYSGIVFTSANGVHMFMERLQNSGRDVAKLPPLHAVGEKTANTLLEHGLEAATRLQFGGAVELAESLGDVNNQFYLHPTSDKGTGQFAEAVADRGGKVNEVIAYRTIRASYDEIRDLDEKILYGEIDCIAFFSPSAIVNFTAILPEFKQATVLVAVIGPTTAVAAQAHGLRVDVIAEEQTAESLADAIAKRFGSYQRIELDGDAQLGEL